MTAKKSAPNVPKRTSLKYLRESNQRLRKAAKDQYEAGYKVGYDAGFAAAPLPRLGLAGWWDRLLRDMRLR